VILLVDVANTSAVAGCRIIQAYVARIKPSAVTRPRKDPEGFTKIFGLSFGERRAAINLHVKHAISFGYEDADACLVEVKLYLILICNSSASVSQKLSLTVAKSPHWIISCVPRRPWIVDGGYSISIIGLIPWIPELTVLRIAEADLEHW
jgi:hypothetical protein